jgi:hypothetical protein
LSYADKFIDTALFETDNGELKVRGVIDEFAIYAVTPDPDNAPVSTKLFTLV